MNPSEREPKELWALIKAHNVNDLFFSLLGETKNGMTYTNLQEVTDTMSKNQEIARALTAFAALGYLHAEPALRDIPRFYFGLFFTTYVKLYKEDYKFIASFAEYFDDIEAIIKEAVRYPTFQKTQKPKWWQFWKR